MNRVSIVLINDNGAEYCRALLASLIEQIQIETVQVIFIDNCSSDDSINIAKEYGIRSILSLETRTEHRGILYNKGLDLAENEYVLFAHTDVVFSADFFRNLRSNLDDDISSDFIVFPQIYPDQRMFGFNALAINYEKLDLFSLQPRHQIPDEYEKYLECSESCFMVHREVFTYFRFDENFKNSFFEYTLLKSILLNGGSSVAYSNCTVVHYFIELHEKLITDEFDQMLFRMKNIEMLSYGKNFPPSATTNPDRKIEIMNNKDSKKRKTIYHVGAWGGNFGDSILQQSASVNLQMATDLDLEFKYINCQRTEFTEQLIDIINGDGDLLLVGGGGLVFHRPQDNSKSGWQWNIDINLIDRIKMPLVFYGIGYNQFEYDSSNFLPITNYHLQKTVEKATLFSVRNQGTKRDLVKRGCNPDKIHVIPDSGMFLRSKKITIPYLREDKLKIGFNWTTDRQEQTFPPPHIETRKAFLDSIIKLLNSAIIEKNAQIVYIGHMGRNFDRDIINLLKTNLIEPPLIIDDVLSEIYPPSGDNASYLVNIYKQMDVVLGMRGHANIVAFGQNTPSIGLGSHRKIRYFLEDIGHPELFFDVRPDSEMFYNENLMKQTLFHVIDHLPQYKDKQHEEFIRQTQIFNNFNQMILQLISN